MCGSVNSFSTMKLLATERNVGLHLLFFVAGENTNLEYGSKIKISMWQGIGGKCESFY
jgi:hypothetical protein